MQEVNKQYVRALNMTYSLTFEAKIGILCRMAERIPRIASEPITVMWSDLGPLRANLSSDSSTRLVGIEGSLRSLLDTTRTPNAAIREMAQERTQYYRDKVAGNFAQVQ